MNERANQTVIDFELHRKMKEEKEKIIEKEEKIIRRLEERGKENVKGVTLKIEHIPAETLLEIINLIKKSKEKDGVGKPMYSIEKLEIEDLKNE